MKQAKYNALVNFGIEPQEYFEYEESLKEIGKEKGRKKKKDLQDTLQEQETRIMGKLPPKVETLNTEAIKAIVIDSVKAIPPVKPQIINKIEKVVEKPQIIETVRVEKEIDRTALDEFAKDILELQTTYHDTLNEIKVSKDFMAGFDGKVEGRVKDLVSPELNKIARSLQSQIYRVSEDLKKVSPTETDPLSLHLDQTTPQTFTSIGSSVGSGTVLASIDISGTIIIQANENIVPTPLPAGTPTGYYVKFTSGTLNGQSFLITSATSGGGW
jgi:hypothetical protein